MNIQQAYSSGKKDFNSDCDLFLQEYYDKTTHLSKKDFFLKVISLKFRCKLKTNTD